MEDRSASIKSWTVLDVKSWLLANNFADDIVQTFERESVFNMFYCFIYCVTVLQLWIVFFVHTAV